MLCTKENVDMSVNKYMSVNKMRSSEEEMGGSARLGSCGMHQEKEHSYSLQVDQLTSGFVACPHCGIWVSKARQEQHRVRQHSPKVKSGHDECAKMNHNDRPSEKLDT